MALQKESAPVLKVFAPVVVKPPHAMTSDFLTTES
jgi:hypothetical protein